MNDVQTNGELKKIFLSKPVENPTMTNLPTTSAPQFKALKSSTDHVRIPPRRHTTPVDKNGEEYLTNHRKQRYWNSWEELYLVELWRRYKDEIPSVNVPLPVYRKMMIAMRNRNMIVTAQDCRRKINTINTRYKQELLRIEGGGYKSEWRLFPLIHCVLQPKVKEYDPWHEPLMIKKLLDKIPKPVEIPAPVSNNINIINNNNQTPQEQNIPTKSATTSYQPHNVYQTSLTTVSQTPTIHTDTSSSHSRLSLAQDGLENHSILPFRNITRDKIERLRDDNNRLLAQRNMDLKCLHMEEANFRCFEEFIRTWTEKKEIELKRVQLMSVQKVVGIENEENRNVEQQLKETIAS